MLDTNICIYAMKRDERVLARMLTHTPAQIHISVVTEAELRLGAAKSSRPQTLEALENFLAPIQIVDFCSSDTETYASVRSMLEGSGTPIGPLDTLIASHALAREMIMVTNNSAEFARVQGLTLENWAVR